MPKVLVIVPFPFGKKGLENRRAQLKEVALDSDFVFDFRAVKAGPTSFSGPYDWTLMDMAILEAGLTAQAKGYDAVCIDIMSDSGANALRAALDIPVIAPARTAFLTALMLGHRFSIISQWPAWHGFYHRILQDIGIAGQCASIRTINIRPDAMNLLAGKENEVFPLLAAAGRQCIEDGAEVICIGSTTMHEAGEYLARALPVPVINPGPLSYKMAEALVGLRLRQSALSYAKPRIPKNHMIHAMLEAAAVAEAAQSAKQTQRKSSRKG